MSNTYWTLKHLENLGGKLSTDGKSFTLGEYLSLPIEKS